MSEQPPKEEILDIIKEIESSPNLSQRAIAKKLGISLGKTNYLLKKLIKKGLVKVHNLATTENRMGAVAYNLTKEGFMEKMRLTYHFLKRKEEEYARLRAEFERMTQKTEEKSEKTDESEKEESLSYGG